MKYSLISLLVVVNLWACNEKYVSEILSDAKTDDTISSQSALSIPPFKNYLAVNAFEWDFTLQNTPEIVDENRFSAIRSFTGIRHYLDWERIEPKEGEYTFSVSHAGSWDYDLIYQRMKEANMDVLIDLKTCPKWLLESYPVDERDEENVPAPYGLDRSAPATYILQAKAGFQLAARYGYNKNVKPSLVRVNTAVRWAGDQPNTVKIGLGLIKYIECGNERDKWWKGKKAQQTPEEYAANLSAFYDGDKGKLGEDVGVKTADPTMMVVMGGLAYANPDFVVRMIEWCKKHRGFKADGTVDLCFDIINYHLYSNDSFINAGDATVGVAPEISNLSEVAEDFLKMARADAHDIPVWVTETGYDIGANTSQRAIPIGKKNAEITQADWNLRTALLYARIGIKRCMFYMLDDVNINSTVQYSSSGFLNNDFSRRPSADYMLQTKKLIGDYFYNKTISADPIVDLYKLGEKEMYVLTIPDQTGRSAKYELNLGNSRRAIIHTLQVGSDEMLDTVVNTINGKLQIEVTETPVFVER